MARPDRVAASGSVFLDIADLYDGRGGLSSSPLPVTANPVCTLTLQGGVARLSSLMGCAGDPGAGQGESFAQCERKVALSLCEAR